MIQVHKSNNRAGFTIVELSLSMVFISVLLLAIALLTLQISTVYNKGLTTKAVNEAGQLLSSDLQRTLNVSESTSVKMAKDSPATGGRLCVDSTVYAWNYGRNLSDGFNKFAVEDGVATASEQRPMRFVRFPSNGIDFCALAEDEEYPNIPDSASDLLAQGDVDLAVYKLEIAGPTPEQYGYPVVGDVSGQMIYPISLVVGSAESSNGSLESNVGGCAVPVTMTDDQYCAVNQFNFTARAGNKAGV